MDGGSLSFFDDFVVVDGVPVFHLDPHAARGLREEGTEITCWVMSNDGTRLVAGHKNGCILSWDSAHGRLDGTYESVFDCPVAAVQFCGDGNQFVSACTFVGNFALIDLMKKLVVRSSCKNILEENQAAALYCPIVHWPAFSQMGKYLVYPVGTILEVSHHAFMGSFLTST